jgi:hypothetical protein
MKTLLMSTVIVCILAIHTSYTQHPVIAVQNGNSPAFFTVLEDALDASEDGDTLYFPGGSFQLTSEIDKTLHFVGTGHYPNNEPATGISRILGNVYLVDGADSCTFEGFYLNNLYLANGQNHNMFISISGIKLIRCNAGEIQLGGTYNDANNPTNDVKDIVISECVVRGNILGKNAKSVVIEKNIITGDIRDFNAGVAVSNNIFLNDPTRVNKGVVFNDNIFLYDSNPLVYDDNHTFNNNVFVYDFSSGTGTSTFIDNITGVAADEIFVNFSGTQFDYEHDYHLKSGSPAAGAGIGGKDAGIYGHLQPYTDGITSYPYIHEIHIPNTTDESGTLNIEVKVSARDY